MKIRIKGNTLRLRLSQSEVRQLELNGSVSDSIHFPGNRLGYTLSKSDRSEIEAGFEGNQIVVKAPLAIVKNWTETETVGFQTTLDLENEESLFILVEKDFKCSADRNEDESDLYDPPV